MTKPLRILLSVVCLLCTTDATAQYRVAAGAVDLTPAVGTFMAGYGADRQATGALDTLWGKVLVVQAATETLVLITLDNIGLTRPDVRRIQQRIGRALPQSRIVVSSTHTHAGPDVVGIWGPALWRSGRDEHYIDALIERVSALAVSVHAHRQPARVRVASVQAPLNWVENVSEPELLDRRLTALQFVGLDDQTLATLTNYACHPTVLGPDNTLLSADYVQGFYTGMQRALPGEHLFLQGAIGGWVQPLQGDRSFARAGALGAELADAALAALDLAEPGVYGPLAYAREEFDIPLENWRFRLLIAMGVLQRELHAGAMRTEAAIFSVGGVQFMTHPGETSPAYALASRQLSTATHTVIMGLTQDAIGYILKPDYFSATEHYPSAEYLTSVSVGPAAGPRLMQALQGLLTVPPATPPPAQ